MAESPEKPSGAASPRRLFDPRDPWRPAVRLWSLAVFTCRRFWGDRCPSVAASLSYTTLLAIVPLAAISFASFSAFPVFEGVQEEIEKFIFENFVPAASEAVRKAVKQFVANTGRLTYFGIIGLAITAILLLSTIEDAFNVIWRQKNQRGYIARFLIYWAIVTVGPLLLGSSLVLSSYIFTMTQVAGIDFFEGLAGFLLRMLPFTLSVLGLMSIYLIMPSRRVRWTHALAGGLAGSAILHALRLGFASYVTAFPSNQTIYGALSAIPIFLIWMYLGWCAILFGGELAASIPEWRQHRKHASLERLSPAERLALAVGLLAAAAQAQRTGAVTGEDELGAAADADPDQSDPMIDRLIAGHYLARTKTDGIVLNRDLSRASLYELAVDLDLVLAAGPLDTGGRGGWRETLATLVAEAERGTRKALEPDLRALIENAAAPGAAKKKRPG